MRYGKSLKIATIGLFVLILGLLIWPIGPVGAFSDNFDTYEIGALNGQGDWTCNASGIVGTSVFQSSPNAVNTTMTNTSCVKNGDFGNSGTFSYYLKAVGNKDYYPNIMSKFLSDGGISTIGGTALSCVSNLCNFYYYDPDEVGNFEGWNVLDTSVDETAWQKVNITYDNVAHTLTIQREGGAEKTMDYVESASIGNLLFSGGKTNGETTGYFDTIFSGPPVMYITATAPATGSTITDTEDTLTIDYFNIDSPYTGFTIGFQDNIIFSNSESVLFNTTGSGTKVISLADFGITTNGHWDLKGIAFGTHLDIQNGFLTTRGYIDFFSDELVDPAYYLLFNVVGLETPYTFTEPADWYSANVDRFPAPTAFFTSFTGLLGPIFLKVAEFGRQVEPMFDSQGAYDRGYALGEIFPFIGAYVDAINVFCGGFPMVGFFIAIILILTAMFVIRTIIKFIPFTGN